MNRTASICLLAVSVMLRKQLKLLRVATLLLQVRALQKRQKMLSTN